MLVSHVCIQTYTYVYRCILGGGGGVPKIVVTFLGGPFKGIWGIQGVPPILGNAHLSVPRYLNPKPLNLLKTYHMDRLHPCSVVARLLGRWQKNPKPKTLNPKP